jgi:DNA polymerase-3 subunit alpha
MAFGTLQDFEGEIDLVFFSRVYADRRHLLKLNEMTALKGSVDPENEQKPGKVSFKVSSIADLELLSRTAAKKAADDEKPPIPDLLKVTGKHPDEVHIKLHKDASQNNEGMLELRDYLAENSGSNTIFIHIPVNGEDKTIRAASGLDMSGDGYVIEGLKQCKCVAEVWRK